MKRKVWRAKYGGAEGGGGFLVALCSPEKIIKTLKVK